jgi:hypothetical protein
MSKSGVDLSTAEALAPRKPVTVMHKLEDRLTGFQYYNFVWWGLLIGVFLLGGLVLVTAPVTGLVHSGMINRHQVDDGPFVMCFVFGGFITLCGLIAAGCWLYKFEEERLSRHDRRMQHWERENVAPDHGLIHSIHAKPGTLAQGRDGFRYMWDGMQWGKA